MSESKSLASQNGDLFPSLGENSLANNKNVNVDDDEDLDLDKMFAKYLKGMDEDQIKALILMEMGDASSNKENKGGGGGEAKGKPRRRKRGDTEEENQERLIDKVGGIAESEESSSDDSEVAHVKSRPSRKGAVPTTKSASAKSPSKKKIEVKSNAGATEKRLGALRSSSSSNAHSTSKLKPPKTSATSHDSSLASTPARPPQKRTLSKGATPNDKEAKASSSSTLNSKAEKRSTSSSKGSTNSSSTTVVGNHHGVGSGVSIRPSLLPLRNTAKATPSSTYTTAAQGPRGSSGSANATNANGGEGRLNSNNNNEDNTAAVGVAPKDRKSASSPSQDEVNDSNESVRMYKEIIEKNEEASRKRRDDEQAGGRDEDDEDESLSGEVSEEDNPVKVQRTKEPFRYEAQITLRKGPHILSSATTASSNGKKKDHSAAEAKFTFQDLVDAVISPDERTAKTTSSEEISEALAIAKIVDLSGKNVSESDDIMCLDNVTTLYLQHNALTEVGGLSALMNLSVLVISHNTIESLSPLATLECLIFLDASWNNVSALDAGVDLPSERLVELRIDHNPCAPDYELLERYDAKQARKQERKGQKHADGKAKKTRRVADESGLVNDTETLKELDENKNDENEEDNDDDTSEISEGEVAENFDYLEQYRAEILAACPLLRYLDGYEVTSFAPEHVEDASIREDKPRLLADLLFQEDFRNEVMGGRGKSGLNEEAVMRAVEDEVNAAIQRDLERDTDEDDKDYDETHQTDVLDMENRENHATANSEFAHGNDSTESPAGLSELQSKLMAAYLELGHIKQGGRGGALSSSSRPSTRMSTHQHVMRPSSSSIIDGASLNATISSLVGASSRPGTAGGGRPTTASSKAAMSVMALGKGGAPSSSSRNKERNAKASKEVNGTISGGGDDSSSSSDDDVDIGKEERLAAVRGRVGSAPATRGGEHEGGLIVPTINEDKAYAMVSDRQKELAKELVVAQRHRDKLAELGLMEFWESATGELRALRVQAEDRRRRLLFGDNEEEERPATSPLLLASLSVATVGGSVRRLQQALLHTKNNSSGSADTTVKTEKDGTSSRTNGNSTTNREMQHSAGYLAALETLKRDAGVVGDINRYKRPMFDK